MLKSIREEAIVTDTLRRKQAVYPRVWEAFDALCWVLTRRQLSGAVIQDVYHLHKQEPGGRGVPGLTVIYTVTEEYINLLALRIN